jgi:hypothetical protein
MEFVVHQTRAVSGFQAAFQLVFLRAQSCHLLFYVLQTSPNARVTQLCLRLLLICSQAGLLFAFAVSNSDLFPEWMLLNIAAFWHLDVAM